MVRRRRGCGLRLEFGGVLHCAIMSVVSTKKYGPLLRTMVTGIVLFLPALTYRSSPSFASAQRTPCSAPSPGAPMLVTAECLDPRFNEPYVDIDEQRATPVAHRYIHGGFKNTDARFSFYFPPSVLYKGRFFQITHQLLTSENASPDTISFAIASGGYFVQTNLGGVEHAKRPSRLSPANSILRLEATGSMRKQPNIQGSRLRKFMALAGRMDISTAAAAAHFKPSAVRRTRLLCGTATCRTSWDPPMPFPAYSQSGFTHCEF